MIEKFLEYACKTDIIAPVAINWQRVVDPKVIFDLGCREGTESIEFAKVFPTAQVYGFECNPEALAMARENLARFPNITLVEGAVSDKAGEVPFFQVRSEDHWNIGTSSLLQSNDADTPQKYFTEIRVSAFRLDEWARQRGIQAVDILWMDIQGSELPAMRGMGELLRTVKAIWTEVSYSPCYHNEPVFAEVRAFLEALGFVCVRNWPGLGLQGDALFFNKFDVVT